MKKQFTAIIDRAFGHAVILSNLVLKPYQVRAAVHCAAKGSSTCIHCGSPATKEALFKQSGIIVVEKYCDDCLKSENFTAIMTFYSLNEEN